MGMLGYQTQHCPNNPSKVSNLLHCLKEVPWLYRYTGRTCMLIGEIAI